MRSWKKSPKSMRKHVKVRKRQFYYFPPLWNGNIMSCHIVNELETVLYIYIIKKPRDFKQGIKMIQSRAKFY